MSEYFAVLIETYCGKFTSHSGGRRARPLPRQFRGSEPIDVSMHVECSNDMRNAYDVGTVFRIMAKMKFVKDKAPCLYCHFDSPYEVITMPAPSGKAPRALSSS